MVRSHRASAARREGVSNHDPSSRSSLLTTDGIEETTSARAMQGEGRTEEWSVRSTERVDAWVETAALDLRPRRRLLTTNGFPCSWFDGLTTNGIDGLIMNGFGAMLIKCLPFVVSPSNHERNEAQPSPLPYALSGTPAGVGDKQNADSRFPLPVSLAPFQPSEANHSSSEPSLTPSNKKVER